MRREDTESFRERLSLSQYRVANRNEVNLVKLVGKDLSYMVTTQPVE